MATEKEAEVLGAAELETVGALGRLLSSVRGVLAAHTTGCTLPNDWPRLAETLAEYEAAAEAERLAQRAVFDAGMGKHEVLP